MSDNQVLPDQLPGLNLADTLERIGVPGEILKPILLRFAEANKNRAADLAAAVNKGDYKELTLLSHALKGASASIGAARLQAACLAVEMAAKDQQAPAEMAPLLAEVDAALQEVLSSLATLAD